jgi:hypothetical protein
MFNSNLSFLTALINCHETGQVQQVLSLVPSTGLHDNGMSHLICNAKGPVARRKRVTTRSSKSFDLHVYQELQFSLPTSKDFSSNSKAEKVLVTFV